MTNKNKVVYFLIGVDIDKGIKFIDDEAYTNMLQLLNKTDDPKETQEDYDKALVILNNPEWEKE
jgi:aromatic ring hydroxylase